MSDTTLHELCKGFGALLSRSKTPHFPEEAAALNERGNLPLHAACSFQASQEVVEALLKAYPGGASQPNAAGNLPIHQAAMWQAPMESTELLLRRYPEGATVRNQYGSLPLHMAASNQASVEVVRLLIDAYPDALHLQNDDGMTPLDLALADESASEAVVAMLEGRPPPPELTRRQQADKFEDRADALERKLLSLKDAQGSHGKHLQSALLCLRRMADRIPHALYAAGIDPNELELAFGEVLQHQHHMSSPYSNLNHGAAEQILLEAVKKRSLSSNIHMNMNMNMNMTNINVSSLQIKSSIGGGGGGGGANVGGGPRDRVEDLLSSIVGLDHIKSQVRGLRRTAEISDLKESLMPQQQQRSSSGVGGPSSALILQPDELVRPSPCHMVFVGNPGTGKTAVARLLAKAYHELGLLRKPKFLEVERMDLVARDAQMTALKTREVLEEAKGGILFIDEAYTLGITPRRSKNTESGTQAILELVKAMETTETNVPPDPLLIVAGFSVEMQQFLSLHPELRKQFPLTFEFPDYSCQELAQIFFDLCRAKGFDLEESTTTAAAGGTGGAAAAAGAAGGSEPLTVQAVAQLLEQETTREWRSERNGRISEMLLAGARTEVRRRMRMAAMEEDDEFDPHLILMEDVVQVVRSDFK